MSRKETDRHIIWSDVNLNIEDWREGYKDYLEANELDADPADENALFEWMWETNGEYLDDERSNLNIQLPQEILVIADLGLWNGRPMGYKEIPSGNIKDCLYSDTDYTEWYVDEYGEEQAVLQSLKMWTAAVRDWSITLIFLIRITADTLVLFLSGK